MAQKVKRVVIGPARIDPKRSQIDPAFGQGIDDRAALILNGPFRSEGGRCGKQRSHLLPSPVGELAAGQALSIGIQIIDEVRDDFDFAAIDIQLAGKDVGFVRR